MTISYEGNFARLLLRWKGSIWKSVWKELSSFLVMYYLIRFIYKVMLTEDQQKTFENMSEQFDDYTKNIPLTFLLGFYIAAIVKRWWAQFEWVAWPDDLLSLACLVFPGNDGDSRLKRHTISRYALLTCALAWRDVSIKVRKRFPTTTHFVSSGLMSNDELKLYESIKAESVRWFLPLQWIQKLVQKELADGKLQAPLVASFAQELQNYRLCFRKLYCYDWVCIPLVYTQVAALATYGYFVFCLLGRQFLNDDKVDFYVPIFTIVQFLFYVGWFKVGQDLMRPFGTDDDDIELNYILDRHIQAGFAVVDSVHEQDPPLFSDRFFERRDEAQSVPHTKMSASIKEHPPKLHAHLHVKNQTDTEVSEPMPLDPQSSPLKSFAKRFRGRNRPYINW